MPQSDNPQDLFNPGAEDNFFTTGGFRPFDPALTGAFNHRNALWLAEFSRLIYRQSVDERKKLTGIRTRAEILAANGGWEEGDFIPNSGTETQAAFFVNNELRSACLVFRGTLGLKDFLSDAQILAVRWQGTGQVHAGFKLALDSLWSRIEKGLSSIPFPVFFTGHSLGGALATLAAARTLLNPALKRPAAVYTFGSPRVGDEVFGRTLRDLLHCRVVNDNDIVTTVPPAFSVPPFPVYGHTGERHRLFPGGSIEKSPFGADIASARYSVAGVADFTKNMRLLIEGALRAGGKIPRSLMDHAPINYVLRLADLGLSATQSDAPQMREPPCER